MSSLISGVNLIHDLPADKVTGTWSSDGTVDAAYPLTNLDDVRPWKPTKFTVNPTFLLIDHGSAKRIDVVSFIHGNFDAATIHVKRKATNSAWGSPTMDRTVTIPAVGEDSMPGNPWVDLTADPGYNGATGFQYTRIEFTQSALLSIGLIRLTKTLRQVPQNCTWGVDETEGQPATEIPTYGDVALGYSLGVRRRTLKTDFTQLSTTSVEDLRSWYRSCGRTNPTLLILDPSVNEARWMKWGDGHDWRFPRTYDFLNQHSLTIPWQEVGRGLKP